MNVILNLVEEEYPMPNVDLILADLSGTAMHFWYVAVAWHLIIGTILVAAVLGWRPTR